MAEERESEGLDWCFLPSGPPTHLATRPKPRDIKANKIPCLVQFPYAACRHTTTGVRPAGPSFQEQVLVSTGALFMLRFCKQQPVFFRHECVRTSAFCKRTALNHSFA
eukprot:3140329-Rhodomonas_salina.5